MEDIYAAIVGDLPTDREKTAALVKKLRGQSMVGQLGQLTGDKVLAPMGTGILERTQDNANRVSGRRVVREQQDAQFERDRLAKLFATSERESEQGFKAGESALERALRRELEGMQQAGANSRATSADAKAAIADKKELDRYTQALSRDLTKGGLPEMSAAITQVDNLMKNYEGKNLPGMGAGKYSPSQEARTFRGTLQPVANILLKLRSGAAVTDQEYARFQKELLGEGVLASDADFRRAWSDLKQRIGEYEASIYSGYDPTVQENFRSNRPGEPMAPAAAPAPDAGAASGEMTFKEFQEARARGEL